MKKKNVGSLVLGVLCGLFGLIGTLSMSETKPVNAEAQSLINKDTVWRYLDDNTDPAVGLDSLTAWTLPNFDDSAWKQGSGSFGAKNGAIASVNGKTPNVLLNFYIEDSTSCIPAYFFRTTFEIEDVEAVSTLTFSAYADDALALYINGALIHDSRETVSQKTNLFYSEGVWDQSFSLNAEALKGVLVEGENVLAAQLHNNQKASSDLYFGISDMTVSTVNLNAAPAEQVILGVGADETQRQLSWVSAIGSTAEVQVAPASLIKDGVFPAEYTTFSATDKLATNKAGYTAYDATITGLEANTKYGYQIVCSGRASSIYYFETANFGEYEFTFLGDPQLQAASEGLQWKDTLSKVQSNFNSAFVISAGDQICTPNSEDEYSYFIVDELSSTTFAPTIGPVHDSPSVSYSDHYNVPNESAVYGTTTSGGNYWFRYHDSLFMNLNMHDTAAVSNGEHFKFMQETIAANPDVRWKFVIMHSSLFSTGSHSDPDGSYYAGEIGIYRPILAPMFTQLGIDVVLSGHDHVYVRSQMMDGVNISDDVVTDGTVRNPNGTLYLCANSSTGTKFYDGYGEPSYVAYQNTTRRKSAIQFSVTETSVSFNAYFLDDMSVFDSFTIEKPKHVCAPEKVNYRQPTCALAAQEAYFLCKCGKAYEDANATILIENLESWGLGEKLAHNFTEATCTKPKTCIECGEKEGKSLGHQFAEVTCTQPKTCQREGCSIQVGVARGHQENETWTYDNTNHWKTCKDCSEKINAEAHVDTNADGKCEICNFGEPIENPPVNSSTPVDSTDTTTPSFGCFSSTSGTFLFAPLVSLSVFLLRKKRKE